MRLILVRHGQTVCNTQDIWHGWDDCELTEVGRVQAMAVAKRLGSESINALYSSDSRRAVQTAETIGAAFGLALATDVRLRERNPGELEGIPMATVLAQHPAYLADRAADYWGWRPPGGETFREVLARVLPVIDELKERHQGQTVALVTHMCPLRVLISHWARIPIEETYDTPFPSAGVSTFSFMTDRVEVESLNDDGHVAPALEVPSP